MENGRLSIQDIRKIYKLDDVEKLLWKIENDILGAVRSKGIVMAEDDINLLLLSTCKSITLFREISLLCGSGFPDGALILARNIYEQMIICNYILLHEEHEEILKKYYADREYSRQKYIRENAIRFNDDVKAQQADLIINEYKEKYGKKLRSYWWSGKNSFSEIDEYVLERTNEKKGLFNNLHMQYKLASTIIHASSLGNTIHIGTTHKYIDMGTWEKGQEDSLFLASVSLIYLIGETYTYLGLDYDYVLEKCNQLGIFYLKKLQKA